MRFLIHCLLKERKFLTFCTFTPDLNGSLGRMYSLLLVILPFFIMGQETKKSFFEPSDSIDSNRLYWASATAFVGYSSASIALYHAWYKQFPRSRFQFFNDMREWRNVDKAGHLFASYFQSDYGYHIAKWTGLKKSDALWVALATGGLFQTIIEIMDGFSAEWGFSIADFSANLMGIGVFIGQEKLWDEQKIRIKFSISPQTYSRELISSQNGQATSSLYDRSRSLFGQSGIERWLKDYNGHTYWMSLNIKSIFLQHQNTFPDWINLAIGYGASNMFGGFRNTWQENGHTFSVSPLEFPRYSSVYLSPDIDLSRLNVKSQFFKTLLGALNIQKIPAPAVEVTTRGQVFFHILKL
ncbi:MAG TPA: DUF2279 domain-containing protein [Saprospiraceae bacterium]|nr:DUF2279 domain-containing protein [Saprospiraceae bacterium]